VKYNVFVTFLTALSCPVLFFSILRPGRTVGQIFTLYGSNGVFPHKEVPFGVTTTDDVIWGNMPPKPLKVTVNRQIQAKMPKYERRCISKTVNPIKPKFEDKAETTTCTSWVGCR